MGANATQCVLDTIEVVFLRIQARAFAKNYPDAPT
jgi:hypothetical protein